MSEMSQTDNELEWGHRCRRFHGQSIEPSGIYLIAALGGAERKLGEIFLQASTTGALTSNFVGIACATHQREFPGGRRQDVGEGTRHIFLLAVETGEKRRLTSPPGDGREIVFASNRTGSFLCREFQLPAVLPHE